MAYYLYLASYNDIVRYQHFLKMDEAKRQREKSYYDICHPLKFKIKDQVKNSFKIEEIDSLTCCYKNEQDLIKKIKNKDISYLTRLEQNENHLTLVYKVDKRLEKSEIIYDDLLLFEQATNLRLKKNNSKPHQEILTDHTDRLNDFITYIISLAMNKTTKNFLLNPKNITYLTKEEQYSIDLPVLKGISKIAIDKEDGSNKEVVVKKGLRSLLEEYIRYATLYDNLYKSQENSLEVEKNLRQTEQNISLFFRKNYQNLRKMIEWENTYLHVLENALTKDNIDNKQRKIISLQIEKVKNEKAARNDRYERELIHYEDEEDLYNTYSSNNDPKYFENDQVKTLYEHGGMDEVMKYMDLDDILATNDAEKLGIVSPKKK